jgi:H+-transporting ATPase
VTFQRILTYTLNSLFKKIVQVFFLVAGLVITDHAILTPLLMVILMITGDFLAMSLTTDNVRPSPMPNTWRIAKLTIASAVLGGCLLLFAVLVVGKFQMGFGIEVLRTLSLVALVFGSEATLYSIRERRRLWSSRPSIWVVVSTVCDILIVSTLAARGIGMSPLSIFVVGGTLVASAVFVFLLDFAKVLVFHRLGIT